MRPESIAEWAPRQLVVVHEHGHRWIDAVRSICREPVAVRHSAGATDTLELVRSAWATTLLIVLGTRPLDELELLVQVRLLGLAVSIIVVAGTGHAALELAAREFGADAFLAEPGARYELTGVLNCVLNEP